jgi:acylphosphatase
MKKSVRLYISGSVQGVLFRQFVKDQADKHKVNGYVRNLEDGRVEIFLEGDIDSVDKMISISKRGPQHSQIRNVEQKDEKFQGFKEFKILRI